MPGSTQRQDSTFVVVLVAGSAIMAIALGIRASMGVFLAPITDDLAMGTGTFALAMAIQNLVWGVGQPVAGALADRHGTRRVLAAGTIFYMLGMVVMAGSGSAAELHLSGFLSGVGMAGVSFTVVLAAVGRLAPEERRSMALGIATSVGSVGQFLFVPLASVAINAAG
ncbi:MAG: MFS transporter, partial [Acidimicrobiaceae bacterium]|nr:MFS transporter [Acidimicrobiaceae bacterium]